MKNLILSPCALSVCVAASLLAGCGGPQVLEPSSPLTQNYIYVHNLGTFSGETFSAKGVHVSCNKTFQTSGAASGPFPGTFMLSGEIKFSFNTGFSYSEYFTVKSSSRRISGSVHGGHFQHGLCGSNSHFLWAGADYKADHTRGKTSVRITKQGRFGEKFQ